MVVTLVLAFAVGIIKRRVAGFDSRDITTATKLRRVW